MVIEFKGKEGQGSGIVKWFHKNYERMTADDGLIRHRLYRNSENPDTILSIEEWVSEDVHNALMQKANNGDWWSEVNPLLAEPLAGAYYHFVSEHSY